MRILCLDPSLTATGVVWTDRLADGHVLTPKELKGAERLAWFVHQLAPQIRTAALVVLEDYAYGARYVAHQLGELGGVLRLVCHQSRTPWVAVPAKCLKMAATGKGNAAKTAVLLAAVRRLGYEGSDHNVADALWLAHMAIIAYGLPDAVSLPVTHMKGVRQISWPAPRRDSPAMKRHRLPGLRTFPDASYVCVCEESFDPGDLAWVNEGWLCPQCLEEFLRGREVDESTLWTLDEVRAAYGR